MRTSKKTHKWDAVALAAGCIAIAAALLLPLAPVHMNQPVVSWPLDPTAPQSSMLELTAQQPLGMEVRFSCSAARSAADTQDGIVVATIRPGQPSLDELGLVVRAKDDRITASVSGRQVIDDALGSADCQYHMSIQADQLTIGKDAGEPELIQSVSIPQVDVLATSLTRMPGGERNDLSVRLTVDDQFSTTPTTGKLLLTILLIVCAAACLLFLALRDRATGRPSDLVIQDGRAIPKHRHARRAIELIVPAVLILWLFIAPMTDDDGYYAAMARNSSLEGYVGNYYQLLNQSFTPFTWFYRTLGYWESLVGSSQVLLRIPALAAGLLTWALLRKFVTTADFLPKAIRTSSWGDLIVAATLSVTFLAWWLPFDMGVRPEGIVALLSAAVLILVYSSMRRQRLFPLGLASAFAALSIVCHPTGFIALAPLIAGLPFWWPIIRARTRGMTTRNIIGVLAPAGLASAVAFGDGSLHDFLHGQDIFLSRFEQTQWYQEYFRYALLLMADPQGNYAKRAPVLLGIACLVWFAVLFAVSRGRRIQFSPVLQLVGSSLALALVLFWITPSKWTHHFGSLAALGPAFLTLFLLSAPAIAAQLKQGRRVARSISLILAFTAIVVFALSFRGPNSWPYSWLLGMSDAGVPPAMGPLELASIPAWLVGYAVVLTILGWWARRSRLSWRGIVPFVTAPVMAVLFLVLSTGYLVGSFGVASARTWDTYSPWAGNLQDPLATECDAAGAIDVVADSTAQPLPQVSGSASADEENLGSPFVEEGGFFAAAPPPGGVGSPAASQVWGSLAEPGSEDDTGGYVSPWFAIPNELQSDEVVGILVSGRLDGGNSLVVEYASLEDDRPDILDRQEVADSIDSSVWRSIPLDIDEQIGSAAIVLRLVATDATADSGGWLAFTAPSVQRVISLQDYLPADAAVGVSWIFSFVFPCQRQPVVQNGVTEPIEYGVLYGTEGTNGFSDNTWTIYAGGLFGPVTRVASAVLLPAQLRNFPEIATLQVYRFDNPYPTAAYDLSEREVTVMGWQAPAGGSS